MSIDQLCMSGMAVIMLLAALMGTSVMGGPPEGSFTPPRSLGTQAPSTAEVVKCTVERIDRKELKLVAVIEKTEVEFNISPSARISKDKKPAELEMLARGDVAVLTLSSAGSKVVVRIEAISSR